MRDTPRLPKATVNGETEVVIVMEAVIPPPSQPRPRMDIDSKIKLADSISQIIARVSSEYAANELGTIAAINGGNYYDVTRAANGATMSDVFCINGLASLQVGDTVIVRFYDNNSNKPYLKSLNGGYSRAPAAIPIVGGWSTAALNYSRSKYAPGIGPLPSVANATNSSTPLAGVVLNAITKQYRCFSGINSVPMIVLGKGSTQASNNMLVLTHDDVAVQWNYQIYSIGLPPSTTVGQINWLEPNWSQSIFLKNTLIIITQSGFREIAN